MMSDEVRATFRAAVLERNENAEAASEAQKKRRSVDMEESDLLGKLTRLDLLFGFRYCISRNAAENERENAALVVGGALFRLYFVDQ